jgi:hypothetical protein
VPDQITPVIRAPTYRLMRPRTDHLDADLVGQFDGQFLQPVFAAGDQRDAVAAVGEFTGDVGADARGGR